MRTPSIALDFNSDLTTASNGKLSVNVSSKAGNTLEIKEDGIYALADIGGGGAGSGEDDEGASYRPAADLAAGVRVYYGGGRKPPAG